MNNTSADNTNLENTSNPKDKLKAFNSLFPIFSFIKPYKLMLSLALLALLVTAAINLSLGQAVKSVIDNGFIAGSEQQLQATILGLIFLVSLLAVGTFSRFYLMSSLLCIPAILKKIEVANSCLVSPLILHYYNLLLGLHFPCRYVVFLCCLVGWSCCLLPI